MLEGRVGLVTGSSRGLGRGIAVALGRRGASVVVNYLSRDDEAAETVRRVIAAGGDAWPYRADVTDPVQVGALVDAVLQRHGRLDVLVNNVGMFLWRDVAQQSVEEWQSVVASNLSSVFYTCRAVLAPMRAQRWGRIVNLGITGGQHTDPAPHMAAYVAAKAGMIAFSRCLALEEARHGITVNVVCPGVVRDPDRPREAARNISDPDVPVGRPGTAEDVAHAVVFFLGEEADFVTGAVLEVNGGWRG
ncbi:MAG: SDR family oxidoreductase [Bacillota bacterium]